MSGVNPENKHIVYGINFSEFLEDMKNGIAKFLTFVKSKPEPSKISLAAIVAGNDVDTAYLKGRQRMVDEMESLRNSYPVKDIQEEKAIVARNFAKFEDRFKKRAALFGTKCDEKEIAKLDKELQFAFNRIMFDLEFSIELGLDFSKYCLLQQATTVFVGDALLRAHREIDRIEHVALMMAS